MDDKLKREIQEMARKKRYEMEELDDKRKQLMRELEDAQREFDAKRFFEAKNARALNEEEVEKLLSLKRPGMLSRWLLSSDLPKLSELPYARMEGIPDKLIGYPFEDEDETIYPLSDHGPELWGDLFDDDRWFGTKINRTILAFLDDRFIVWNSSHENNNFGRKFLNIPDFVDKILDIRTSDIRWIQSYALIEHPDVWYRGTISWKRKILDRVEGARSIVFRQFHEDIWNYLSAYNLDPNELEFFDLRLDTYDPTLPLNEYEVSKIYDVGIETLETAHKLFDTSVKVPDDRKKIFKPFGEHELFEMVYEDDLTKKLDEKFCDSEK